MQGHLRLAEQLRFLALSQADRRRVHAWLGAEMQRAMKRAVRMRVLASGLEHFEGDARVRKRKAASFARMVGYRASGDMAVLIDKDFAHRGHKAGFAERRSGKHRPTKSRSGLATSDQVARLKELGFKPSRAKIRRLPQGVAGKVIRYLETRDGRGRRRRRGGTGSLMLMVWREQGEVIVAGIDPAAVLQRFLKRKLARAA